MLVGACTDDSQEPLTSNPVWDATDLYRHFGLLGLSEEDIGIAKGAVIEVIHARVEESLRPLSTPGAAPHEIAMVIYGYRSNLLWFLEQAGLTMAEIRIDQSQVEALLALAEKRTRRPRLSD